MKLTQRNKILKLLQENGKVNSYDLVYVHSIKQSPTRVFELRKEGHNIMTSKPLPNGSVDYVLLDTPPKKILRYEFRDNEAYPVYEN